MKKGRHRRFEEARALKQTDGVAAFIRSGEPCAECEARPGTPHASWCMAEADLEEEPGDAEADGGSWAAS